MLLWKVIQIYKLGKRKRGVEFELWGPNSSAHESLFVGSGFACDAETLIWVESTCLNVSDLVSSQALHRVLGILPGHTPDHRVRNSLELCSIHMIHKPDTHMHAARHDPCWV